MRVISPLDHALPAPATLIGMVLALLGLTVTSGWLLHVPMMVEIKSGLVPMVFNTGLCFFLAGCALYSLASTHRNALTLRTAVGIFLALLGVATFLEFLTDRGIGIDLVGLHTWYDYGNTRPGRMAPNTALGFVLAGLTILLNDRVDRQSRAIGVVLMTFSLLAIGLTGLVGYLIAPDLLFGWARSARMALHTACGMILCAIGLWLSWSKRDWYLSHSYFREADKIRFLGAAILTVVTVTVGLVGFVLLQNSLEKTLEDGLEVVTRNRGPWFRLISNETATRASSAVRLTGFEDASRTLLQNAPANKLDTPISQPAVAGEPTLNRLGSVLLAQGYTGVGVLDAQGVLRYTAGSFNLQPELQSAAVPGGAALVWDQRMLTRTHVALQDGARSLGQIVVDQPAQELQQTLFNSSRLGSTGEIVACILKDGAIACFPSTRHTAPFVVPLRGPNRAPLPVQFAIAGKQGIVHAVDYRGHNVVAAYGPLAPGLGFVAKQDATEIYGVISAALTIGAPIILVITALGVMLLYSQLQPLATSMRASELAALEKELEMHTIMDAAGDGILTTDQRGRIQSANPAACRIFGRDVTQLTGTSIVALMPPELRRQQIRSIAQFMHGGLSKLVGTPNIELVGRHGTAQNFPLELTVNEVPRPQPHGGQRLFVGVMRDITERKDAERRLSDLAQYDALTGLPNRALFMDRLSTALSRSVRSSAPFALMFLDLDGFKRINDTLGHQAGDELLIQFAHRLITLVRKTDTVARLAGDEFTVIVEVLTQPQQDAAAVAEKIVASMQQPFQVAGQQVMVTVSVGVVLHDAMTAAEQPDMAELLRRADAEMYGAKHAGKNTYRMA